MRWLTQAPPVFFLCLKIKKPDVAIVIDHIPHSKYGLATYVRINLAPHTEVIGKSIQGNCFNIAVKIDNLTIDPFTPTS